MSDTISDPQVTSPDSDPAEDPSAPLEGREDHGRRARFQASAGHFLRNQPLGVASGLFIGIVLAAALFAPWLAPYSPTEQTRTEILESPSMTHYFGTDDLGRDIFSRVLYGARSSLFVATATILAATSVGVVLGAISGYFGGKVDMVIQRIIDAVLSVPVLLLGLFIVSLLGPSIRNVILALAIVFTPRFSRIARGEMLRIKVSEYVVAAEALGARPTRVIMRHGIPNLAAPIIVLASLTFGQAIVAESALSFLGLGVPPPAPSWGRMLADSRQWMQIAWWMVVFPGAALSFSVLAFNLLGDALRDHLDPKLVR
ncbi:MAG: ABC transporter permease [Actinomycetota bacterium]|nr:ABC transporter permease [Actinomycetota bacterium]